MLEEDGPTAQERVFPECSSSDSTRTVKVSSAGRRRPTSRVRYQRLSSFDLPAGEDDPGLSRGPVEDDRFFASL